MQQIYLFIIKLANKNGRREKNPPETPLVEDQQQYGQPVANPTPVPNAPNTIILNQQTLVLIVYPP